MQHQSLSILNDVVTNHMHHTSTTIGRTVCVVETMPNNLCVVNLGTMPVGNGQLEP